MWKTILSGKIWNGELKNRVKNGGSYWVEASVIPDIDTEGKVIGFSSIRHDISAQKSKEQFLANMSHEIRTPLNAILGFINLLKNTSLNSEQNKYIQIVKTSSESLLGIVNDILDFSKFNNSNFELDLVETDIKEFMSNAHSLLHHLALKKGINFTFKVDDSIDNCLLLDSARLLQVINNLVSNAVKFTDKNETIELVVTLIESKDTTQKIKIEVKDTGIGIAKNHLTKIFDVFSQADNSTIRKYGGTGLGLSISAQLVSVMNSELKVESVLGEGSCFFFTVEFTRCSDYELEMIKEKQEFCTSLDLNCSGLRILVAEDHEVNRILIKHIFKNHNITLTFAMDGKEAVEKVANNSYDLIFMDINMPNMNGVEATSKIRNELNDTTPIIALTANVINGDVESYMEAGMNDYLSKPIIMSELKTLLIKYITQEGENEVFDYENVIDAMQSSLSIPKEVTDKMLASLLSTLDDTLLALKEAIKKIVMKKFNLLVINSKEVQAHCI